MHNMNFDKIYRLLVKELQVRALEKKGRDKNSLSYRSMVRIPPKQKLKIHIADPEKTALLHQALAESGLKKGSPEHSSAFRLYAISLRKQHEQTSFLQDRACIQYKGYQQTFQKLKCSEKKELCSLKEHQVRPALKQEKKEPLQDPWEELMKKKEERLFYLGRITKYFTS